MRSSPPAGHGLGPASRLALYTCAGLVQLSLASSAHAQEQSAMATRTQSAPVIDGRLDDAVWQQATPIGRLTQTTPLEGEEATEPTEVRFLYDDERLYIHLRFFDSQADQIIVSSKERDANLEVDDRFELVLDTFHDQRSAFWFQMNAGGSKSDALIDNGNFNKPWDGIWDGKSSRDAEGWSCELAIPFKTLNFDKTISTWGFNVKRYLGRNRESSQWANPRINVSLFNIDQAGLLTGLEGIRHGIGLDLIPFWVGNATHDRARDKDATILGESGLDAFYKLTTNLTLSLTLNTDFAETEVDERRINLTRFPLFFPERRDFFLQDSGVFSFAGFNRGFTPFFSRTIGLNNGAAIPIQAGLKLTGRVDGYNIGVLDVQTEAGDDNDRENLFVTRISRNLGEKSLIGGIVTHGDPSSAGDNTTYGVDAQFRTSDFLGDKQLQATVWGLKSESSGIAGSDAAAGASISYPNDLYRWNLGMQAIQTQFNPALGFVPRRGIRSYNGEFSYKPRFTNGIRQLEFGVDSSAVYNTASDLETWSTKVTPIGMEFDSGEEIKLEFEHTQEALFEDFEISDGFVIEAGDYRFDRLRLELESAAKRPLSAQLSFGSGTFFDGRRDDLSASLHYRHSALFSGSAEWSQNDIDLSAGSFQTQISRLRARFSLTPDLSWNTFVQWDNESENIGINSRLRWIPTPGHEMFLVVNETLNENRDSLVQDFQNLAFKISYTLRL